MKELLTYVKKLHTHLLNDFVNVEVLKFSSDEIPEVYLKTKI